MTGPQLPSSDYPFYRETDESEWGQQYNLAVEQLEAAWNAHGNARSCSNLESLPRACSFCQSAYGSPFYVLDLTNKVNS